jgi:hypothetical protein
LVLAKNVECPKFSLLLIPWIMASGFIIKTRVLRLCMHSLQFKVTQGNVTNYVGSFVTPTFVVLAVYIPT